MSSIRNTKRKMCYVDDGEMPEKKLVSSGDLFIKELAEKQRNTKINLEVELSNKKEFEKATEYIPITSHHAGQTSLKTFQMITKESEELEKLKSAGLTDAAAMLMLDYEKGENFLRQKHKNLAPNILNESINSLRETVKEHEARKKIQEDNLCETNRNFTESALSIKPDSVETKLFKFALENSKKTPRFPHPMDNIKSLENDLFPRHPEIHSYNPKDISLIRKKARKLANKLENRNKPANLEKCDRKSKNFDDKQAFFNTTNVSKWDLEVSKKLTENKSKAMKLFTCKTQNFYIIKNGEIVKLKPEEVDSNNLGVARQKLSLDEIKEIPRFKNYNEGIPSNKLYIKNLPNNFTETNLRELLEALNVNNITSIQVMGGRMSGQAFIEFYDQNSATKALPAINGILIKNKPIIAQYGIVKEKNETKTHTI